MIAQGWPSAISRSLSGPSRLRDSLTVRPTRKAPALPMNQKRSAVEEIRRDPSALRLIVNRREKLRYLLDAVGAGTSPRCVRAAAENPQIPQTGAESAFQGLPVLLYHAAKAG